MFDLLVIGGLGVDIRTSVPALPLPVADSVTVPPVELRIGNTGAGVALAAHRLGLRVALVDVIGDDPLGGIVRAALDRTTIRYDLRTDPRGTRRSVNLVDPAGRRMSLYDPRGAWQGAPPFPAADLAGLAGRAAHVHVSIMDWAAPSLAALRAALPPGVALSTDLHDWDGANDYHRPFLTAADWIFVSDVRLGEQATGIARDLADGPPPRTVLVTSGADGSTLTEPGAPARRIPAAPPPGPVVDTNGAGDAFAAGFIAACLRGTPAAEAARYAAAVAAAACTHDGMEYPPDLLPTR